MARKLYIVAYDDRQPSRLSKALKVVRGFASGGQKSAYECWLDADDRAELENRLATVLDLGEDSVALVPLAARAPMTALGAAVLPEDPAYYYFG